MYSPPVAEIGMARLDPHSWNDDAQPETERVEWEARVDLSRCVLDGVATLHFRRPGEGPLDLDTRGLSIEVVEDGDGRSLPWTLHEPDRILGSRLEVRLPARTSSVRIRYRTSPNASALQWLSPEQTADRRFPYLYSQCQAIHARSVIPLQDTPRLRITYRAQITVPRELRVVMAARSVRRIEVGDVATEHFEMPQPIPPYLLALAVGDLVSRELGPRSRVWSEPSVVERASFDFARADEMLRVAELLFGPYEWERFDLLTMPPSFPYGGMENPRLTFITPTVLTGDRSLANVAAHELAHSWTGNLVTNASAEHFWLNEGFTVYAERRILEVLEGRDLSELHAAIGRRALEQAVAQMQDRPQLTRLRTNLWGVDPDDAYSQVPYEKGYLFLRALEEAVGRPRFDAFLRKYVETFRFSSLTTEQFLAFTSRTLPGALEDVDAPEWIEGEGIPARTPCASSSRLEAIARVGARVPEDAVAAQWSPMEWVLFLETLPRPAPRELLQVLETKHHFTSSSNMEVLVTWLELCIEAGLDVAERVQEILGSVGRMKFLKPLYAALAKRPELRPVARATFERFQQRYHPIARQVVDGLLRRHGA
jgi:aminopeptidase N